MTVQLLFRPNVSCAGPAWGLDPLGKKWRWPGSRHVPSREKHFGVRESEVSNHSLAAALSSGEGPSREDQTKDQGLAERFARRDHPKAGQRGLCVPHGQLLSAGGELRLHQSGLWVGRWVTLPGLAALCGEAGRRGLLPAWEPQEPFWDHPREGSREPWKCRLTLQAGAGGHSCGWVLPAVLRLEVSEIHWRQWFCGCQGCGLGPVSRTSVELGSQPSCHVGTWGCWWLCLGGPDKSHRPRCWNRPVDERLCTFPLTVHCDTSFPKGIFSKMTTTIWRMSWVSLWSQTAIQGETRSPMPPAVPPRHLPAGHRHSPRSSSVRPTKVAWTFLF